jgi:hypothetical protein
MGRRLCRAERLRLCVQWTNTSLETREERQVTDIATIELPPLTESTSAASMKAQRRYVRGTGAYLMLLVGASFFGVIRLRLAGPESLDLAASAALLCFGFSAIVTGFLGSSRPDRTWYDGRAASESVKTLAWRYAVAGNPFPATSPPHEADALFTARVAGVIGSLRYAGAAGSYGDQITDWMRQTRALPLAERRRVYEAGRIEDQQKWYSAKADWNGRRSDLYAMAALGLTTTGFVLAWLRAVGAMDLDMLEVICAGAASLGAWMQVKQHDALARAYAVTAQELARIRSLINTGEAESEWALFVDGAEDAVSREHTLWLASRGSSPG